MSLGAPRATVWALLSDPTLLAPCLPVPLTIVRTGDAAWQADGRVGNAFIATRLSVAITFEALDPDRQLRLGAHGGASGTAFDAAVTYTLRPGPAEGPTIVDWAVDLNLSGGFAGPINRVIEQK